VDDFRSAVNRDAAPRGSRYRTLHDGSFSVRPPAAVAPSGRLCGTVFVLCLTQILATMLVSCGGIQPIGRRDRDDDPTPAGRDPSAVSEMV
jgi:hypothetical protein